METINFIQAIFKSYKKPIFLFDTLNTLFIKTAIDYLFARFINRQVRTSLVAA